MISVSTLLCALALAVAALGALVSIISLRQMREQDSRLSTTVSSLKQLVAKHGLLQERVSKLSAVAPAGLAVQVAELSDAVGRLAKTQQRFAGKFYAEKAPPAGAGDAGLQLDIDDPELAAELALQNAPMAAPGK